MDKRPTSGLVFVHGAGSNANFWHWQRAAFPEARYIDLPGHGSSRRRASSNPRLEDYAAWLADYIEDERLDKVVLNGHSMGGAIALLLALRHPKWLRGLILTGTGARLQVNQELLELLRNDYPAAVEHIVQFSFAAASGTIMYAQKVRINGVRRQLLRTPAEVVLADYEASQGFDVAGKLGEVSVQTLCIVGVEDRVTPPEESEDLHRAIGGSYLEVIPGAGHMLPLEKPDEYNSRVAEFMVGLRL